MDTKVLEFLRRDTLLVELLRVRSNRATLGLAWDAKLSQGQVIASLKRLRAGGLVAKTGLGWSLVNKEVVR